MTKEQILEKVRGLAKGNRIVEVHILDKANGERDVEEADSIQRKLNELLESEEVLGAIYYMATRNQGVRNSQPTPRGG